MHARAALLLLLLALASVATAQGNRVGEGLGREQMWPAPTAEDWNKPVLITWQRTWKDALSVSKETGKPILVCINMDGEIASEHYAGVRYRQDEIAPLYEPYVCVIASVYRHNPRDHDDQGRRIECPRFGGVTCSEHIWIEPIIYELFCDGQRVAPRHICVDLSGQEVYDVFYVDDTAGVFDAVRDGRKKLPPAKAPIIRGDRPILERVASRAVQDRRAVEAAYRNGGGAERRALLDAALKNNDAEQLDLLRLAVFGLSVDLSRKARTALVDLKTPDAASLIGEALRVPMDAAEREALIATLKKLGGASPRAAWLAGVHTGLASRSGTVNTDGWAAGGRYPAPKIAFGGFGRAAHVEDTTKATLDRPDDPKARLELAEATLALALKAPRVWDTNPRMARMAARHLFGDAKRFALEAQKLGAEAWRVNAVLALSAYYGGEREEAYKYAEPAVKALPPGDTGWNSMAVLTIFAESRWKAIKAAVRESRNWPPEWLTDLHAAYSVLLRHPLGTDSQVLWHYDLLDWLGARFRASRVLKDGLARFKDSPKLHGKLRERALKWHGPDALEKVYDGLLQEHNDPAKLEPFAAYASVQAGDAHRRQRRYEKSLAAYARAIEHYEAAIAADPRNRASADPAIALALAARARVSYQIANDEAALADMLASFERSPQTAGTRDGMGITPGETAQMILARLREKKKDDLADQLDAALERLDPELLVPDRGIR